MLRSLATGTFWGRPIDEASHPISLEGEALLLLSRLFNRGSRRRSSSVSSAAKAKRAACIACESLETRQMLSGGPPAAPSNLVATAVSGHEIDLTFTNNAANADHLYVERSQDGGLSWGIIDMLTPTSGAMQYDDIGRFPGTYEYRVWANRYDIDVDDTLNSDYSGTDSATIVFNAPSALTATAVSGHEIDLAFTNNADNAGFLDVERSQDGGATWAGIATIEATEGPMQYQDTGRFPGTYIYRVRAELHNMDTLEYLYTEYTAADDATIVFNAPSNLTATAVSGTEVALTFTNNADNADNLDIERSNDGGATWNLIGYATPVLGAMEYNDTGLAPGTYTYRVRAEVNNWDQWEYQYTSYTSPVTCTLYEEAPTVSASAHNIPYVGEIFTLDTSYSGSGYSTIDHWNVDWGDGTGTQTISGNPTSIEHVYAAEGDYAIHASCTNADGTYAAAPVEAAPTYKYVFSPTPPFTSTDATATFQGNVFDVRDPMHVVNVAGETVKISISNAAHNNGVTLTGAVRVGDRWELTVTTGGNPTKFEFALSTTSATTQFIDVKFESASCETKTVGYTLKA